MFEAVIAQKMVDAALKLVKRTRGTVVLRTITYTSSDQDVGRPGTATNSDITLTISPIVQEITEQTTIVELDLEKAEIGDFLFWISPTDVTEAQLKGVDQIIYGSAADGYGPFTLYVKEFRTPEEVLVYQKPMFFLVVAGKGSRH